jgi:hypothetical protein
MEVGGVGGVWNYGRPLALARHPHPQKQGLGLAEPTGELPAGGECPL